MKAHTYGRFSSSVRPVRPGAHTWLTAAGVLVAAGGLVASSRVSAAEGAGEQVLAARGDCGDLGDTAPVNDGFPQRLSSLVGADIRTGGHDCFERVVLELQGDGDLPGYQVQYESDPILDSPRGAPVDVAGDATLVLSVGAWMTSPDSGGYQGPSEFVPTNVDNILELQMLENFEGMTSWAIGLDRQRDFDVFTLDDPVRIVIDIARDAPLPATTSPGATVPSTATPTAPQIPPTRFGPPWSESARDLMIGGPMGPMGPMGPAAG
ncbi:AMIN-like domain-containing (lipo)protein [Desertimonas flava]|uniref:AMIN-like domain-containing (lipo)protein n=1 Tax=Desertimonas flava TaxID=2064846 RepID=UPI000E34E218|nr:hypothetical protein [Desertimonas flava]